MTLRLSPAELLAAWEALDLGEPPPSLGLHRPFGDDALERHTERLLSAARTGLAHRGLVVAGRPTRPLANPLSLLARAEHQLDIRFTGPADTPVLGLGARDGAHGVILHTRDAHSIELTQLDASGVPAALLALLGPIHPGHAMPVNIPEDLYRAAREAARDGGPWAIADQLRARGIPAGEASALARMAAATGFGGQLAVTARRGTVTEPGPWVIHFVRGETGWFLVLVRDGTLTAGPADTPRLLRHWADLVDHLPQTARTAS